MVESEEPETKKTLRPVVKTIGAVIGTGLLVALIIPNFIRCRCMGPLTICKSNLKNLGTALEMYSTDWSGHYPRNLYQLTPNYLKEMPVCSEAKRMTYRADFGPNAPGNTKKFEDYYFIECAGANHTKWDQPADYPQYNSVEGIIDYSQ